MPRRGPRFFHGPAGRPPRASLGSAAAIAVVATLAVALPLALSASGEDIGVTKPRSANLDSDAELEAVVPLELCESADGRRVADTPCRDDEFSRRRIVITDTCESKPRMRRVSSVQDWVDRLRVIEADGRGDRPEVFFDLHSGAAGRGGETRVVRYGGGGPTTCPEPEILFRYPAKRTRGRLPRGAVGRAGYAVNIRDYTSRYAGREVRLGELYVDRNDAFCCPTFRRTTFFRYSSARDKHVRYKTRVGRLRG